MLPLSAGNYNWTSKTRWEDGVLEDIKSMKVCN